MTRLAAGRTTHLEPEEIAAATLRLFDQGGDPSIRQLAVALNVTPSAIYHHYASRAEIVQAAVEIVWAEILTDTAAEQGNPFEADPVDVLVAIGLFTRRAFLRHYTIAPYMTAIPRSDELSAGSVSLFSNLFERLGLGGEGAGDAFHLYANYCFGNALFAAGRLAAKQRLDTVNPGHELLERIRRENGIENSSSAGTRAALEAVLVLSETDPARDEELFVLGLRQLLANLAEA